MPNKISIFLCQACGWKRVSDLDNSGLTELGNDTMSARKFRCPKCGRAIAPRQAPDPQSDIDLKAKEERTKSENEAWMLQHTEFQKSFLEELNGQQDIAG